MVNNWFLQIFVITLPSSPTPGINTSTPEEIRLLRWNISCSIFEVQTAAQHYWNCSTQQRSIKLKIAIPVAPSMKYWIDQPAPSHCRHLSSKTSRVSWSESSQGKRFLICTQIYIQVHQIRSHIKAPKPFNTPASRSPGTGTRYPFVQGLTSSAMFTQASKINLLFQFPLSGEWLLIQ